MYVEASNPAIQGQKARMCGRKFLGHTKKRLTFKYHSYVVPNTILTVIWKNLAEGEKVLWTKSGLERNEWLIEALTITSAVNFVVSYNTSQKSWNTLHIFNLDKTFVPPPPLNTIGFWEKYMG